LGSTTQFTNLSMGTVPTYTWDFGDGSSSTDANPNHVYTATGTYTITLVASNDVGSATATGVVEILRAPEAAFTVNSPLTWGETAVFTNTSSGDQLQYLWDFGDGSTSTAVHPSHLYTAPGTYTVILTASNDVGSDMATAVVQILAAHTSYLPFLTDD
jgi:PKD repeat protein